MLELLLLLGQNDCLALRGLARASCARDVILDHLEMASLFFAQRYVPAALVGFVQDQPFAQPFGGTHLAAELDCSPNLAYCPGNRG